MSKSPTIIHRRDLRPLLLKAYKIVKYYEKAANCLVSVLGPDYLSAENPEKADIDAFSTSCGQCLSRQDGKNLAGNRSCTAMHFNAVQESRRLGGSYIYMCPAGFIFWTSPIYSGERFAGALVSGGVHSEDRSCDEIKALAQMMLICAGQISDGNGAVDPDAGKLRITETYPLDKERQFLANLRRGDNEEARKNLREILNILYASSGGNFDNFRLRAIEMAVLVTRAADSGTAENQDEKKFIEAKNRYLKKFEDAKSAGEISNILESIMEQMSGKIFSFQGIRHSSALRKAERFIWENYTRKISLQEIAHASGLSAPYFSTVFKEEMGENLSNYLNRLRVEKAASMLSETNSPICKIAAACGFEDQSWFSKIFKNYTGLSPGKYRESGGSFPPVEAAEIAGEL